MQINGKYVSLSWAYFSVSDVKFPFDIRPEVWGTFLSLVRIAGIEQRRKTKGMKDGNRSHERFYGGGAFYLTAIAKV